LLRVPNTPWNQSSSPPPLRRAHRRSPVADGNQRQPRLDGAADQEVTAVHAGGNMEGKEVRLGPGGSALLATGHGHLGRGRQLRPRQLYTDRWADRARSHPAGRGEPGRGRLGAVRHAHLGAADPGIPRQEDHRPADNPGCARPLRPAAGHPRVLRSLGVAPDRAGLAAQPRHARFCEITRAFALLLL